MAGGWGMDGVVGWDIGGVNTKVARAEAGVLLASHSVPLSVQYEFERLPTMLRQLAAEVGAQAGDRHALTFTAELSQRFRTKAEGVSAILDAVDEAFPGVDLRLFTTDGQWIAPAEARRQPLRVSAANWVATATCLAADHANALLIDVGSTTTDIIPIVDGKVRARGQTDLERLAAEELVYTGAVRTPIEAVVRLLPVRGEMVMPAAEGFALMGDVHVWLDCLAPEAYVTPTPDGRPATREFAAERLMRVVCADRTMLSEEDVTLIARTAADAQVRKVLSAVARARTVWPQLTHSVVVGLGDFIAERAARMAGMDVVRLRDDWAQATIAAPAAAAALLLSRISDR